MTVVTHRIQPRDLLCLLTQNYGSKEKCLVKHSQLRRFLQMPSDSQPLYFHMILRADDDGIVESYPLIKLLGAAPDSFKVLWTAPR